MDAAARRSLEEQAFGRSASEAERRDAQLRLLQEARPRQRRWPIAAAALAGGLAWTAALVAVPLAALPDPPAAERATSAGQPPRAVITQVAEVRADETPLFLPESAFGAVESVVLVGLHEGLEYYGVFTAESVWLMAQSGDNGWSGKAVPRAEFERTGLDFDRGSWGFTWNPDGTVEWVRS